MSFGRSNVFGPITNDESIIVSGNSNATFFGDITNNDTINVSAGSTAVFFGALSGNGVGGLGTKFLEGDTRPSAIMAFGGDVVFGPLAQLEVDLEGTGPGQSDRVTVAASVSLAGVLDVQPLGAYSDPDVRGALDTFTLVSAGSRAGNFASVNYDGVALSADVGPDAQGSFRDHVGNGLFREVSYTAVGVELTNYFALVGDANGDGTVDFLDVSALSGGFGGPGDWQQGNFNGDAIIDFLDVSALSGNFGMSVTPALTAVPEPSAGVLLLVGLLGLGRRRSMTGLQIS